LRQIIRLVEEWADNGRKRHETTLLRILNTALGVLQGTNRRIRLILKTDNSCSPSAQKCRRSPRPEDSAEDSCGVFRAGPG